MDSNYAKIIFEKQEQSALAYAVRKIEGAGPLERPAIKSQAEKEKKVKEKM